MDPSKPNKPSSSSFKQQKIKSWTLKLSPMALGIFYLAIGCIFLMMGIIIVVEAEDVTEHRIRYDNKDACDVHWKHPQACVLKLHLSDRMDAPIFVYYEISNMYQNHRRYNKNRNIDQLMGNTISKSDIKPNCYPVSKVRDLGLYVDNPNLSPKSVASPCGLIAKSKFNDTYKLTPNNPDKSEIRISFNDITWSHDRNDKFKNHHLSTKMWTSVEDSHFINWMNIAGLPTFKKLWGKINSDLHKGTYSLEIQNNYDVSDFDGKKTFILTTTSNLGGKMSFLGIISLIVAVVSILGGAGIVGLSLYAKKIQVDIR